jgi:hypothetical protein
MRTEVPRIDKPLVPPCGIAVMAQAPVQGWTKACKHRSDDHALRRIAK